MEVLDFLMNINKSNVIYSISYEIDTKLTHERDHAKTGVIVEFRTKDETKARQFYDQCNERFGINNLQFKEDKQC